MDDVGTSGRRDRRIKTHFETLYSAGKKEGVGVLTDISFSGAMLVNTTIQPEIGTEMRLFVFLQPVSPFELVGTVVRHIENGFAIEYKNLDDEVRRLVEDASAIVGG